MEGVANRREDTVVSRLLSSNGCQPDFCIDECWGWLLIDLHEPAIFWLVGNFETVTGDRGMPTGDRVRLMALRGRDSKFELLLMVVLESLVGMKRREEG